MKNARINNKFGARGLIGIMLLSIGSCGNPADPKTHLQKKGLPIAEESANADSALKMSQPDFKQTLKHEIHLLDVVGDSEMDTLILGPFDGKYTHLSIIEHGIQRELLIISPRFPGRTEYLSITPPIERIYLEANSVATDNKSLRLIIRNTDASPGYYFFDLSIEGQEIRVGLCGIYDMGELGVAPIICTARYNQVLPRRIDGVSELTDRSVLQKFWSNTICP